MADDDKIKDVVTDNEGRVSSVTLKDGNKFDFKDFIQLFKSKISMMNAGEVITWDDEWRYQRQIDPSAMETYADVVEAKALTAGTRFQLSSRAKVSIGVIIILFFVAIIGLVMLKNSGML